MAIVQQLQAETAAIAARQTTQSVTLGAGSNRLFIVAVASRTTTSGTTLAPDPTPITVTYGVVSMSLVTDGTNVAASRLLNTALPAASTIGTFWYVLRESELPSNGRTSLFVQVVEVSLFSPN